MDKGNYELNGKFIAVLIVIAYIFFYVVANISGNVNSNKKEKYQYDDNVFSIITTPENKVLEQTIKDYADDKGFEVNIQYADNLEIVDILNGGEKYDAIWASNSIWLHMIDSKKVSTSDLKSTSITPIVFGVKKSLAESLGLTNGEVTMNDLLQLIKDGKLKFSMANPIATNSGASAYLNIISTLAGNPEVLTADYLEDKELQDKLISFFTGLERTSGDEDFLEESFINGDYDAAISYESSIISINKKLEEKGKEPLYLIYPVDGVSISDSPLVFINNGNPDKKEIFLDFQSYILSEEGQKILEGLGRRTWYGGITDKADTSVFNPKWGIDTTKYISPVKYPSKDVIKKALVMYQNIFRKPVHVVFCLDYSGSMRGNGYVELKDAIKYVFGEEAAANMIQFSERDKIDILLFSDNVKRVISTTGDDGDSIINIVNRSDPYGGTALHYAVRDAFKILQDETSEYNVSIIVMTDGEGNVGHYSDVEKLYKNNRDVNIPIYSITFGDAVEEQLEQLAELSNGKVFDGKTNLIRAFKEVRGYN